MKVVAVSNFDNEMVPDRLVAENISMSAAQKLCDEKNQTVSEHSDMIYVVRPDDYKLYEFIP